MQNNEVEKIIHNICFRHKERLNIFQGLPIELRAQIILRLTKHMRQEILFALPKEEIIQLLEHLDPDEATDIIRVFPKKRQHKIIIGLKKELQKDIDLLLKFSPESAGGLMSLNYIQVNDDDNIIEVAKQFKVHEKRTGRLPIILVMRQGRLTGYLPGHVLGLARGNEKAKKYVRDIPKVESHAHYKEIIDLFHSHLHTKIAVIGEDNNVLGIIYSDDMLRFLNDQETKSLYNFAGVSSQEQASDSILGKVKARYKWLILNLATGFLAAAIVGLFDETISKYILLAVYMPIVAGMGGNAATQTLAILVREISLKQINPLVVWRILRNEMVAGFINGVINSIIITGVILFLGQGVRLALILSVAMTVNLMVAGIFGTIIPLLMHRLGKDPASSATIFITTITDVLGFLVFLGLAAIFL